MLLDRQLDDERRFNERAAQGELMFNYGLQFGLPGAGPGVYDFGHARRAVPSGMARPTREELNATHHLRRGRPGVPAQPVDEAGLEGADRRGRGLGRGGPIGNAGPLAAAWRPANKRLTLQQLGWVVATELRLYRNAFFLGFETGGATGDQAEDPTTYLNYRWKFVPQPAGDRKITDFKFSPDYHVDEILFRRLSSGRSPTPST